MKLRRMLLVCAGVAAMAGLGCDGDSGPGVQTATDAKVAPDVTAADVLVPDAVAVADTPLLQEETSGPITEPTPIVTVAAEDEAVFQTPPNVPEMLPYMHMPVPDSAVDGWQAAPLNPYPQMIESQLSEVGFRHVAPLKPRLLKKPTWQPWTRGSRIAVQDDRIYVVDTDNGNLVVLNRDSGAVVASVRVGPTPMQVVVSPAGRVFVSVSGAGEVVELDAANHIVTRTPFGTEPVGLALTPAADRLLVADRSGGQLLALDLESTDAEPTLLAKGLDFPRALSVSPGGRVTIATRQASVSRLLLSEELSGTAGSVALRVSSPLEEGYLQGRWPFVQSGSSVSIATHPETGAALVLHTQRLPGDGVTASDQVPDVLAALVPPPYYTAPSGWRPTHPHLARAIEASVSAIAESGQVAKFSAAAVRDPVTLEPITFQMSVPQDIAHHPTLSLAFVASAGTDCVVMLNTSVADPMASPLGVIEVGMAPAATGFSSDGWFAYVLDAQSFAVSEVDLRGLFALGAPSQNANPLAVAYPIPEAQNVAGAETTDAVRIAHRRWARYGSDPLPPGARLGRRLFVDARNPRITGRERFACASCHVEGGEDQTVWWFPSGPRQTPALAGRLEGTAPYNWNGTRETLIANMERTIRRMGGVGATQEELKSLERYLLEGLTPPRNPNLAANGLTEAQARGKELFEDPQVGCAGCHLPGAWTDGLAYDFGLIVGVEKDIHTALVSVGLADPLAFNTPSLRGVWATAPYLHNGKLRTLRQVLAYTRGKMGDTTSLTAEQLEDLVRYLETL